MARMKLMNRMARRRMDGHRITVDFDYIGEPTGPNAIELQCYIGALASHKIPVSFNSGREVNQLYKDKLWDSIQTVFILDRRHKKMVLRSAGNKWKDFRSRLAKDHNLPFLNEPQRYEFPPNAYSFITRAD